MELLGFDVTELIVLAVAFVLLAIALQIARSPRSAHPALRILLALVLVAVIAGSWAGIRLAKKASVDASMRAAKRHGVDIEALRAKDRRSAAKQKASRGKAGARRHAERSEGVSSSEGLQTSAFAANRVPLSRSGSAKGGEEEDEDEEEEEEEDDEEEEEGAQRHEETEEELFGAALAEDETEAEYAARRQRADRLLSLRAATAGMVGGARASSASAMQGPRNMMEADSWLGGGGGGNAEGEEETTTGKLSRALTLQGLRDYTASTLFAKESYAALEQANHGYGEGMDLRYVDPSLRNFDYAFAAYDDAPVPPNPLPVNTPILF
jgi:hypothetical protein